MAKPLPASKTWNPNSPPPGTIDAKIAKTTILGYTQGQVAVKNPALSKYGSIPQMLEIEGSKASLVDHQTLLTRAGIPAKAAAILLPYLPIHNDHSRKETSTDGKFGTIQQSQILGIGCVSGDLLGWANFASGRGSAEIAVDLGCTGEGKGRIVLRFTAEGTSGVGGSIRFDVFFQNVCDNQGNCVDGAMLYRLNGLTNGTSSSGNLLMSLALRVSAASGETASIRQGLRISFSSEKKAGSFELLAFLKNDEGKEVSAVLQLDVQGDLASFTLRGSNGSFTCSTQDKGRSGSCQSSAGDNLTW